VQLTCGEVCCYFVKIVIYFGFIWFVCKLFHYKDRSIIFLDLCSNRDSDFWERILSLKSPVSLFYLLFYLLFWCVVSKLFYSFPICALNFFDFFVKPKES